MTNGATHLPSDFLGDIVSFGDKGIDGPRENFAPQPERQRTPSDLSSGCGVDGAVDTGGGLKRSFDVDPAVDGANGL
jgi:hypothetical protein